MFKTFFGGKKTRTKVLALSLITTLLTLDIKEAGAFESFLPAPGVSSLSDQSLPSEILPEIAFRIPAAYGQTLRSFQGDKPFFVVLLQDAHVHEEAQLHLAELLKFLSENYRVKLVSVEGAEGELGTHAVNAFPDKSALRKAAGYFLKNGRLTGAEYAAMILDPSLRLFGAEDRKLYEQNRDIYFKTQEFRGRDQSVLKETSDLLQKLSRYVYAPDVQELLRSEEKAFQDSGRLETYVYMLAQKARHLEISEQAYGSIAKFLQAAELEKRIQFEEAREELAALEQTLKIRFPGQVWDLPLTETSDAGGEWRRRDWAKIIARAEEAGLGEQFPQALRMAQYFEVSRSLGMNLTQEIRALAAAVKEKLLLTDTEKKFDQFLQAIRIYESFLNLSLTQEDAEFFFPHRALFSSQKIREFVEPLLREQQFEKTLPADLDLLDKDLPELEKFYQAALLRDKVLVERTVNKMQKERALSSALVAGGFHTAGIERRLREKGISFVTVMPRMTKVDGEEESKKRYEDALSEKPLTLEDIFKVTAENSAQAKTQDTRFQLVAWLMSSGPAVPGEKESRIRPLFWLAAVESLLGEERVSPAIRELEKQAGEVSDEGYRSELRDVLRELEGGVLEQRSEDMKVYWQRLPEGAFRAVVKASGKDRLKLAAVFGVRRSVPIVDLGGDEILSVLKVDGYLVPEKVRRQFDAKDTSARLAEEQTAARAELRTHEQDSFRKDVEERQQQWLEETLEKVNRIFAQAEAYLERQETIDSAKLSRFLEQGVTAALRELEDLKDTEFHQVADAALSARFKERWNDLLARIGVRAPEAVEQLKNLLPALLDSEAATAEAEDVSLTGLLSTYRGDGTFFQTHSLEQIQQALEDFQKQTPSAARETRVPGSVRFAAGLILFYVIPGTAAYFLQNMSLPAVIQTLLFIFSMRVGYLALTLAHEWTHLSAAVLTGAGKDALTRTNLTGSLKIREWAAGIFAPLVRTPRVMIPALRFGKNTSQHSLVRDAAWMMSGLVALAGIVALVVLTPGLENILSRSTVAGVAVGFALSFFAGFWSDILRPAPKGVYCCGNYGAAYLDTSVQPPVGGQDLTSVRARVVKTKRGQLPDALRGEYKGEVRKRSLLERLRRPFGGLEAPRTATWFDELLLKMSKVTVIRGEQAGGEIGYAGSGSARIVRLQGHSRYGTSSAPAVKETQPHTWLPERKTPVWSIDNGVMPRGAQTRRVSTFVTHNGDFDFWELYGKQVSFDQVAVWLKKVLGVGHPAKGDTPKLAGVIDYVFAQGMWDAALRFAFYENVADTLDFRGLPQRTWKQWGARMDELLSRLIREGRVSPVREWSHVPQAERDLIAAEALRMFSESDDFKKSVPESKREGFIKAAVQAFLENDLYTTARIVKARSEGSFGVIITSSLQPEKTVLFAHSQPLFIGYDPSLNLMAWASEAAALKVAFTVDGTKRTLPYRFDMDQETGEILELRMDDGLGKEGETAQSLRVYSEFLKRELTPEEVSRSGRVIDTRNNPLIDPLPDFDEKDLVGSDIKEIPYILNKIEQTWQDPESFNRQSAYALLEMLVEKDIEKRIRAGVSLKLLNGLAEQIRETAALIRADLMSGKVSNQNLPALVEREIAAINQAALLNPPHVPESGDFFPEGQSTVDVLLTGFEVSQWFGEQFISDLSRLFPALTVEAVSSNKVLKSLKETRFRGGAREFRIQENNRVVKVDRNTVVLAVSQSGQTFPTLNATIALRAVLGERVFAMTGGLDTLMGRAVGQVYAKGAPFSGRIFDNLSGLRPAEPSTVATAAVHATFTEMLLYLGTEMKRIYGERRPLGMAFELEDLDILRKLRDELNTQGLPAIAGASPRSSKETVDSPVRRDLIKLGKRWAQHILEPAIVIGLATLIVGIASYYGLPFFPSSWGWLQAVSPASLVDFLISFGIPVPSSVGAVGNSIFFVLANGIYAIILFPWFLSLGLRLIQRRFPLLARTGKRTLVIGDIPYVHQTLEAYVSKILSLSYGFASLDVHAANPRDHYLPRFGHRIVRGLLSLLMEPDARLHSHQDEVGAVRMTKSQQEGVRNFQVGAEVFTLGRKIAGKDAREKEVALPVANTPIQVSIPNFIRKVSTVVTLDDAARRTLASQLENFAELFRGKPLHLAAKELGISIGLSGNDLVKFEEEFLLYGERQHLLERMYEKRLGSFERLVSAYVIFWALGRIVSRAFRFLRLTYDMAASQSRTRVATTRSPDAAVNLNLLFSQIGEPESASRFNSPAVPLPFRVETAETVLQKSRESEVTVSAPVAQRRRSNTGLTRDDRRKLYQRGIEMGLEKIVFDLFIELKNLEDQALEPAVAAHLDRSYTRLRKEAAEDLEWFQGKIDPTRLEELKYLIRQALTNSRERVQKLRSLQAPAERAPRVQNQPSESFLRLRQAQSRLKDQEEVRRQIAKTFVPLKQERAAESSSAPGSARAELREAPPEALNPAELSEALLSKSSLAWLSEERRLLPGLARAEAAGIDLEKAFTEFAVTPGVVQALGLPGSSRAGTRGYYLFEYRAPEDRELLKKLLVQKAPGIVVAVFAPVSERASLVKEFTEAVAQNNFAFPETDLVTYLNEKSRELKVLRNEVIHFRPLVHVKLKKNYEEALQVGALPLAAGGIVIRSESPVPGARELRVADVIAEVLKAALLVERSA